MCLHSDKTIKVDRDSVEVLPRRVPSPKLATDRNICELSLPSERDTWAVDLCPQLQCHVELGSADLQPGGWVRGGVSTDTPHMRTSRLHVIIFQRIRVGSSVIEK